MESRVSDEEVSSVRLWTDTMDSNVLTSDRAWEGDNLAFMMDMRFRIPFTSHFLVETVEDALGLSNPRLISLRSVQSRFGHEIQETREDLIVPHVTSSRSCAHGDKSAGRECILRNTFLIRGFVVVSAIKKERVDGLIGKGVDISGTRASGAVNDKGIRIKRSNGLAAVTMNQSHRK
jgi:hypothetical protein